MVDILGSELGPDPVHAERFELEHGHGAGGVLQQGVIDADADFFTRDQVTLNQVLRQYFPGQVLAHDGISSRGDMGTLPPLPTLATARPSPDNYQPPCL